MAKSHIKELFDLSDKVAIVTGGVKGLGWQAAEALAEAGANVVLTSRTEEVAVKAAEKLSAQTGMLCLGAALEVASEEAWLKLTTFVQKKFARIDILVNNAGGRKVGAAVKAEDFARSFLEGRPLEEWCYSLDVMLTGVFLGCRAVAPFMKAQGHGKIINIASIDGVQARDLRIYEGTGLTPTVLDYLAAKGGVINLTKGVAAVLAPYGICVNCISPGGFERGQPEKFIKNYSKTVPLGRMGDDERDLKGPVLFAASAASDYMVGHNLVIDGGFTIW